VKREQQRRIDVDRQLTLLRRVRYTGAGVGVHR